MQRTKRALSGRADLGPVVTSVVLSLIGVLLIYSSGKLEFSSAYQNLYKKQLLWIVIALIVSYPVMKVSIKSLAGLSYPLYAASLALLILVLALPASGPHRWIRLGSIQIQPSEVAKLFTILALAKYLGGKKHRLERLADFIVPLLIVGIPAFLILIEPDLGTASVFIPLLFAMLYWSGARPLYLLFLLSPLISLIASSSTILFTIFLLILIAVIQIRKPFFFDAVIVIAMNIAVGLLYKPFWNRLEIYQKKRLLAFLGLESDPLGIDWQKIQSQVAIGSGGFWGKGFLEGTQKKLAFLPEQHTDFIFSIVGEETGFVGVIIILLLYFFLLFRALHIARSAPTPFSSIVSFGILSLLFVHVFVNITMVTGYLPVIGLPLPFLSYGGSSLVMFFIAIALLVRMSFEKSRVWLR
jgi:rod shape determining protein RodA